MERMCCFHVCTKVSITCRLLPASIHTLLCLPSRLARTFQVAQHVNTMLCWYLRHPCALSEPSLLVECRLHIDTTFSQFGEVVGAAALKFPDLQQLMVGSNLQGNDWEEELHPPSATPVRPRDGHVEYTLCIPHSVWDPHTPCRRSITPCVWETAYHGRSSASSKGAVIAETCAQSGHEVACHLRAREMNDELF